MKLTKFKAIHWIAILGTMSAIGVGVYYWQSSKSGKTPQTSEQQSGDPTLAKSQPSPALSVSVITPQLARIPTQINTSGAIVAWQEASVAAEIGGLRIERLLVDVGDYVKKGQVLALLADDTLQAELLQAKAALTEAEANLAEAQATVARAAPIVNTGVISQQQFSQYKTNVKVTQAKVNTIKAQINTIQLKLRFTKVLAPDSGTIISRQAVLGSVGQAGTELFRLMRNNRLEWRAEIPTEYLGQVFKGTSAVIQISKSPRNKSNHSLIYGKVREVAPQLVSDKQIAMAFVSLPYSPQIKPGMFVSGHILLPSAPTLVIPAKSIIVRDGQNYVYLVNDKNQVYAKKISTGRIWNNQVEILDGLGQGNERIVLTGANFLADGDLVKVVSPNPQMGASETNEFMPNPSQVSANGSLTGQTQAKDPTTSSVTVSQP